MKTRITISMKLADATKLKAEIDELANAHDWDWDEYHSLKKLFAALKETTR